jgi:hypothetical protein
MEPPRLRSSQTSAPWRSHASGETGLGQPPPTHFPLLPACLQAVVGGEVGGTVVDGGRVVGGDVVGGRVVGVVVTIGGGGAAVVGVVAPPGATVVTTGGEVGAGRPGLEARGKVAAATGERAPSRAGVVVLGAGPGDGGAT